MQRRRDGASVADECWGELAALVEHLEGESARLEGRSPRPAPDVWAEIERVGRECAPGDGPT